MEVAVFAAAESLGDFLSERIERRAVAHIAVYRRRIARQYNVSRTRGTLQSAVKAWAIVSIGFASWFSAGCFQFIFDCPVYPADAKGYTPIATLHAMA